MTHDPTVKIRNETPDDYDAVRNVTVVAFANSEFGHNGEADLVDNIRENQECVSLVACQGDDIVGHVMFSAARIETADDQIFGMGLAPMAVIPTMQRRGVGSSLVEEGLRRLSADDCPFVVVLGHPAYYPRFGFQPASVFGVTHGFAGIPQEMLFLYGDTTLEAVAGGRVFFGEEFGQQH